ncbi:MAG: tRNA uridine-5-carboxymethylaminomethyl(34) synthesis enzyme MnmG [Candidatus Eisenbacteria sp.]|nr:tRNA uridine-5-carboxymethylaminomethyl(34) synthesis enzyme MnmG [Candidatus Eisenbacteria bacterium]
MSLPANCDAVVVGGGHAGIEAAWALGRRGHKVVLVTFDARALGRMSCNPSVGGLAKGQLAREVDALGGLMGRLIDRAGIHFRMLNRRKGPAVHGPRAQADKPAYCREAWRFLATLPSLRVVEAEVTEIETESSRAGARRVTGVRLAPPRWSRVEPGSAHSSGARRPDAPPPPGVVRLAGAAEIAAPRVILTIGTFLEATLFSGLDPRHGGRRGEPPAGALGECLRGLGLPLARLKTGTPPRLQRASIDFASLEEQPGDEPPPRFSFFEESPVRNRVLCYLTRTNARTHEAIRAGLDRSPLFGGLIHGVGPRYCPSIEDKVVRFPDRTSHQIFLEPEGLESEEIYPNGISTSLPVDVQLAYVRTIPGLECAQIVHPGYAVEYDFLQTSGLDPSLSVRGVTGLYAAGQINGTSGYEEAAAQGVIAGLNACAELEGRAPLVLRRDQAYIGVLIDDLITKVPTEPYRMFTSQSEYRLLLRQDNADQRLSRIGWKRGLLAEEDYRWVEERWGRIAAARRRLGARTVTRAALHAATSRSESEEAQTAVVSERDWGKTYEELLRKPEVTVEALPRLGCQLELPQGEWKSLEADVKYEGYIPRLLRDIAARRALEETVIPFRVAEDPPQSLSREARERLRLHRPRTLGQAGRIPGVTPCDISLLAVRIRALRKDVVKP